MSRPQCILVLRSGQGSDIITWLGLKDNGLTIVLSWNPIQIIYNPPFVGSRSKARSKKGYLSIYVDEKGKTYKTTGKIDYVSGWYFKAAVLLQNTTIRTAITSINYITQGEQVVGVTVCPVWSLHWFCTPDFPLGQRGKCQSPCSLCDCRVSIKFKGRLANTANDKWSVLSRQESDAGFLEAVVIRLFIEGTNVLEVMPTGIWCACVKYGQKDRSPYWNENIVFLRSENGAFRPWQRNVSYLSWL